MNRASRLGHGPIPLVPDSPSVCLLCDGPDGPALFARNAVSVLGLGSAAPAITRRRGALLTIPAHAGRTHAIHRYEEKE